MTDKELINALMDYNYQLSNKLEELAPQWYYKSELITEIDDFWKENIDGTEHGNEYRGPTDGKRQD